MFNNQSYDLSSVDKEAFVSIVLPLTAVQPHIEHGRTRLVFEIKYLWEANPSSSIASKAQEAQQPAVSTSAGVGSSV